MEDTADLKQLCEYISFKTNFPSILLEKDYYLTKVLIAISKQELDIVFKGGTCLNKCYLGFYRLSEDLDFISKEKPKNKTQARKLISKLKKSIFKIFRSNGLSINEELGFGWKMINSKENVPIGLEMIGKYKSIFSPIKQTIKLEISFRGNLYLKTNDRKIAHLFVNQLGEPILSLDAKIECIALEENFAEKIRALITRKKPVVRDIFDTQFIIEKNPTILSAKIIDLVMKKIHETKPKFSRQDLREFLNNLNPDLFYKEELDTVLRINETYEIETILAFIKTRIVNLL